MYVTNLTNFRYLGSKQTIKKDFYHTGILFRDWGFSGVVEIVTIVHRQLCWQHFFIQNCVDLLLYAVTTCYLYVRDCDRFVRTRYKNGQ
jgi:hypothetical protein